MDLKWYIIIACIFFCAIGIVMVFNINSIKKENNIVFGDKLKGIEESFLDISKADIVSTDVLKYNLLNKEVTINITIMVNGIEYSVTNYVNWFKEKTDSGWKFGANVTIPNNSQGNFIANNLEEIRFNVEGNIPLKKLKQGFNYKESVSSFKRGGITYNSINTVDFDFTDILNILGVEPEISTENGKIVLKYDVRTTNFTRGQTIFLDPTINVGQVNQSVTIDNNITTEAYPLSHISLNDSSLVLYMPFDVNQTGSPSNTTYSYSSYNLDGTVLNTNTVVWNQNGLYGGSYYRNGGLTDFIKVPYSPQLNNMTNYTVSIWFKLDNTASTNRIISSSFEDFQAAKYIWLNIGTTVYMWYRGTPADWYGCEITITQGTWTQGTFTFQSFNGRNVSTCYKNGAYVQQVNGTSAPNSNTANSLAIMGYTLGNSFYNGSIDEIMIFNRSLSSTEISSVFNNQTYRFKTPASQIFPAINIQQDGSLNRINITTNSTQSIGSSISLRLLEWNTSFYNDSINGDDINVNKREGLIGYWHLDNISGIENNTHVFDWSGNNYNGTIKSLSTTISNGYYSNGISFNGEQSSYQGVNITSSKGMLSGLNSTTISLWFKADINSTIDTGNQWLLSKGDLGYTFYSNDTFLLRWGGTLDKFMITFSNYTQSITVLSSSPYRNKNWTNIVCTYDGTLISMYIDGVLDSTGGGITGGLSNSSDLLSIGGYQGDSADYNTPNGTIDEVMIFNRSLDSSEILRLYTLGKLKLSPGNWQSIGQGVNNVTVFNISNSTKNVILDFNFSAGQYNFYSPLLRDNIIVESWSAGGGGGGGDTIPPYFTGIPANASINYGQSLFVTFNATDETAFNTFSENSSLFSINSTGGLINSTGLQVGPYIINISISDAAGNINSTYYRVDVSIGSQTIVPKLNGVNSNLVITYPQQFNASADNHITTLTIKVNGTTITEGSNYTYGAGLWYVNFSTIATINYTADEEWLNVTILPSGNPINSILNGINGNLNIIYPQQFNASTVTVNNTPLTITVNGTTINRGTNYSYGAGGYNVTWTIVSNQNYTSNVTNLTLNINKSGINLSIYLDGGTINKSISSGTQSNATCYADNQQGNINLSRNSTVSFNGLSPETEVTTLAVGYYNYTCSYAQTQNYTSSTKVLWLNVTSGADSTPPVFTNLANKTTIVNISFGYQMTATDNVGVSCFTVNDTALTINCSGLLKNNTLFSYPRLIWLNVTLNDTTNNKNYGIFYVNITDPIPPSNVTVSVTSSNFCKYTKLGYYNTNIPFMHELNCIGNTR